MSVISQKSVQHTLPSSDNNSTRDYPSGSESIDSEIEEDQFLSPTKIIIASSPRSINPEKIKYRNIVEKFVGNHTIEYINSVNEEYFNFKIYNIDPKKYVDVIKYIENRNKDDNLSLGVFSQKNFLSNNLTSSNSRVS